MAVPITRSCSAGCFCTSVFYFSYCRCDVGVRVSSKWRRFIFGAIATHRFVFLCLVIILLCITIFYPCYFVNSFVPLYIVYLFVQYFSSIHLYAYIPNNYSRAEFRPELYEQTLIINLMRCFIAFRLPSVR